MEGYDNIDLSKINRIIISNPNVIDLIIDDEKGEMILSSRLNPDAIDANFAELDSRVSYLEEINKELKMRM